MDRYVCVILEWRAGNLGGVAHRSQVITLGILYVPFNKAHTKQTYFWNIFLWHRVRKLMSFRKIDLECSPHYVFCESVRRWGTSSRKRKMAKAEVRQSSHLLLDPKTPEHTLKHNHAPHFHYLVEGGAVGFLSLPTVDVFLFHALSAMLSKRGRERLSTAFPPFPGNAVGKQVEWAHMQPSNDRTVKLSSIPVF